MTESDPDLPGPRSCDPLVQRESAHRAFRPSARTLLFLAVGIWLFLAVPKFLQHISGNTGDLDTGNYHHLAWALGNGHGFGSSILDRHHLGEHFSPIMALVAIPYLLWPNAQVLMFLQATAVWGAVVLVLWQAMRELRDARLDSTAQGWLALSLLTLMLAIYPPLLATWQTQFQPIELGAPLVVLAMLLIRYVRLRWLWLVIPLLLGTRESAPLAVAGIAVYALVGFGRWRLALVLGCAAAVWAVLAMGVVMPWFRGGADWRHVVYLDWGAAWDAKGTYLVVMLLGLGIFPYLGRRALAATLGVVPGLLLNLSVDRETQYGFGNHYDAQTAPFLMLAAAHGMGWLAARAPTLATLRRRIEVWGAYALSVVLAIVLWDEVGAKTVIQRAEDWWPQPAVLEVLAEGRATARRYADAPALTAHHQLGPHIAARPRYFADRSGRSKDDWVWFAASRLRPGHIFIVVRSDALFPSGLAGQLRASGAARLIETGAHIQVWQWPLDAPAPGTPEAQDYVARHYQEPDGG